MRHACRWPIAVIRTTASAGISIMLTAAAARAAMKIAVQAAARAASRRANGVDPVSAARATEILLQQFALRGCTAPAANPAMFCNCGICRARS
jgi:hypothetical protein